MKLFHLCLSVPSSVFVEEHWERHVICIAAPSSLGLQVCNDRVSHSNSHVLDRFLKVDQLSCFRCNDLK